MLDISAPLFEGNAAEKRRQITTYTAQFHDELSRKLENVDISDFNYTTAEMIRKQGVGGEDINRVKNGGYISKDVCGDIGYVFSKTFTGQNVSSYGDTTTYSQTINIFRMRDGRGTGAGGAATKPGYRMYTLPGDASAHEDEKQWVGLDPDYPKSLASGVPTQQYFMLIEGDVSVSQPSIGRLKGEAIYGYVTTGASTFISATGMTYSSLQTYYELSGATYIEVDLSSIYQEGDIITGTYYIAETPFERLVRLGLATGDPITDWESALEYTSGIGISCDKDGIIISGADGDFEEYMVMSPIVYPVKYSVNFGDGKPSAWETISYEAKYLGNDKYEVRVQMPLDPWFMKINGSFVMNELNKKAMFYPTHISGTAPGPYTVDVASRNHPMSGANVEFVMPEKVNSWFRSVLIFNKAGVRSPYFYHYNDEGLQLDDLFDNLWEFSGEYRDPIYMRQFGFETGIDLAYQGFLASGYAPAPSDSGGFKFLAVGFPEETWYRVMTAEEFIKFFFCCLTWKEFNDLSGLWEDNTKRSIAEGVLTYTAGKIDDIGTTTYIDVMEWFENTWEEYGELS